MIKLQEMGFGIRSIGPYENQRYPEDPPEVLYRRYFWEPGEGNWNVQLRRLPGGGYEVVEYAEFELRVGAGGRQTTDTLSHAKIIVQSRLDLYGKQEMKAPWSWFAPFLEFNIQDRPGRKPVKGGFNQQKTRFHLVIWNEAGLGWFARIMKSGTDAVYNYGPFERGRMRTYLMDLFPSVDLDNRALGIEGILNASKGAGVLVQVDASVLSQIWKPVTYRKWKTSR